MSRPRVLCVDDSEAVLALEEAWLSAHHTVDLARDGAEALARVREVRPDCVLLDLSMPGLDGREVLRAMRADAALRDVPVIVVTSEVRREAECMAEGATGFVAKPLRAPALLAAIEAALLRAREARRRRGLAVLEVGVGPVGLALPIEAVRLVTLHPRTGALAGGPPWLDRVLELHGRPVCVLDLARRLGVAPAVPLTERRLVVVGAGELELALRVDRVEDPRQLDEADLVAAGRVGGAAHAPLSRSLLAVVRLPRGLTPVLDPAAFLSPELLAGLPDLVAAVAGARA